MFITMTYILRVPASSARRELGDIRRLHSDVECISSNYLMHVR